VNRFIQGLVPLERIVLGRQSIHQRLAGVACLQVEEVGLFFAMDR
jgi:hypothetical protein